jgi:membrane protease YdiL (CAAX protease family)
MPMHVEITPVIVILEAVLELSICGAVIWLNWEVVKEAFKRKFPKKNYLIILLAFVVVTILGDVIFNLVATALYSPDWFAQASAAITAGEVPPVRPFNEVMNAAPAAIVGARFDSILPLGAVISPCIAAPIVEELIFRMSARTLMKNVVLYVLVSSLLFGFIHTANFFTLGILYYFFWGILFAGVYLITKDIRINIAVHMIGNVLIAVGGFLS